jgi:DNA-binding XRE family transcriptional regulator
MLQYSQCLADAVKKTRLELSLTQEEVADKCDTDVRTIINMEMGRGNPKLKTLFRVVHTSKIDTRELFDDVPQSDSPSIRRVCLLINECSEEEAATLLPVIEAVLTALRTNKGIKIE